MTPIEFPEQTTVWAQAPYLPLFAFVNERETISCWALTWRERWRILWGGRLWIRQGNFGEPLQPICPTLECPFSLERAARATVKELWDSGRLRR